MACAVFKTVGRRLWRLRWVRFPHAPATRLTRWTRAGAVALALAAPSAQAQIPVPLPGRTQPRSDSLGPDTVKVPQFRYPPPIAPLSAMARSLLLPGWGQAVLHRRVTGAVFVFWEGLALTMTVKASNQLKYMRATNSAAADLKRQEVQDWLVVLIFNHLMAGAEAFVSAELWDFPSELKARSLPGGRLGIGPTIYWARSASPRDHPEVPSAAAIPSASSCRLTEGDRCGARARLP